MQEWALALSLLATDTSVAPPRDDPWLAPDKVKHGVLAFAIQSGAYATVRAAAPHRGALVGSVVVTLGLSVFKEQLDRDRTGFSIRDLVWDAAGIVLAAVVVSHAPQER